MDSETKPPDPSQDTASLVHRLAGPSTGKAGLVPYSIGYSLYLYMPNQLMNATLLYSARLAKDQTEINRIIAEASKGSKFYEARPNYLSTRIKGIYFGHTFTLQNEKKKDKDLTERIARVLKQRDEALQGVDICTSPTLVTFNLILILCYILMVGRSSGKESRLLGKYFVGMSTKYNGKDHKL
jgi:DNA polymerase kappa